MHHYPPPSPQVFEQYLHPRNAELTVIGDFDPQELKREVLRIFGSVQTKEAFKMPPAPDTSVPLTCHNCYATMACPKETGTALAGDASALDILTDKFNASGGGSGARSVPLPCPSPPGRSVGLGLFGAWGQTEGSVKRKFDFPLKMAVLKKRIAAWGGVPCAVRALCEKFTVLHHREFGKFRRLEGCH